MADNKNNVSIVSWPSDAAKLIHTIEKPFPVCIKLCEPICAKSEYTVNISIFDHPVATINVRGITRVYNCNDEG